MKYCSAFLLIPFLVACGGEKAGQSGLDGADGTMTDARPGAEASPSTNDGEQAANNAKSTLADLRIPYGIAHYPGADILGVSPDITSQGGKNPQWYQYDTMDEPEDVLAFYKVEAEKAGFSVKSESSEPAFREISLKTARPGGGLMKVNTLGDRGGKLLINLYVSEDD